MKTVQKKIPMGKNPCGEKFLRGNIPAGIFPHGENKNVNIYLKDTQMCQTDCKSEPKLDFRPLNRFLKIPAGIFSPKIPAGKNPRGEKWKIVISGGHSFLHTINMRSCHIWIKRWVLEFSKIPAGKFLHGEKIPAGMVKNPRGEIFSPRGFANPRGDFDLCRGIFSRSLQILSQKPIEFPQ